MADIHPDNCGCLQCINARWALETTRLRAQVDIRAQQIEKIVDTVYHYETKHNKSEHDWHKHVHAGCLLCDIERILEE